MALSIGKTSLTSSFASAGYWFSNTSPAPLYTFFSSSLILSFFILASVFSAFSSRSSTPVPRTKLFPFCSSSDFSAAIEPDLKRRSCVDLMASYRFAILPVAAAVAAVFCDSFSRIFCTWACESYLLTVERSVNCCWAEWADAETPSSKLLFMPYRLFLLSFWAASATSWRIDFVSSSTSSLKRGLVISGLFSWPLI